MLNRFIKEYVSPVLTDHGFRRSAAVWNRRTADIVHVLDVQRGRPEKGCPRFTLNLGALSKDVWMICWGQRPPKFVREQDCFPRFRIGLLLADFSSRAIDRWWALGSEDGMHDVGEEVRRLIEEKCVPVLDSFTSLESILEQAKRLRLTLPLDRIYLSILLHLTGDETLARQTIDTLTDDPYWGARARQATDRLRTTERNNGRGKK